MKVYFLRDEGVNNRLHQVFVRNSLCVRYVNLVRSLPRILDFMGLKILRCPRDCSSTVDLKCDCP